MPDDGVAVAVLLDGSGGGREVDWNDFGSSVPMEGVLWVHLSRDSELAVSWSMNDSGLDAVTADALLAEETRPRTFSTANGLFVILRGMNLNPGADPEDMVGLRLWLEEHRIITVYRRQLLAVQDVRVQLDQGHGPKGAGDFLVAVTDRLIDRMGPVIGGLEEQVDRLEEDMEMLDNRNARETLRRLRGQAIVLRRYLAPQRDVLLRLHLEDHDWLSPTHRLQCREIEDRLTRYVEALDSMRERASLLQEELIFRLSESTNRTIYILTIVAAIMLPLTFITGLLGINVGGIPGAENSWAFAIVCLGLAGLGALMAWLFRRFKWM